MRASSHHHVSIGHSPRLRYAGDYWFPAFAGMTPILLLYFFFSLLCGLRFPMRPLSLPAPGSSTALISVGLPESIAALTARFSSSGEVALTPTPPNASRSEEHTSELQPRFGIS